MEKVKEKEKYEKRKSGIEMEGVDGWESERMEEKE